LPHIRNGVGLVLSKNRQGDYEERRVVSQDTSTLTDFHCLDAIRQGSSRVLDLLQQLHDGATAEQANDLSRDAETTRARIAAELADCDDVVYQTVRIRGPKPVDLMLIFIENLAEREMILRHLITPLREGQLAGECGPDGPENLIDRLSHHLSMAGVTRAYTIAEVVEPLLVGNTAVLVDGFPEALIYDTQGWAQRAIEEAPTEMSLVGPHDSFTENIETNVGSIRRRIRSPNLKVKVIKVGADKSLPLAVMYRQDRARAELVAEILERIRNMKLDLPLSANYIKEAIIGKRVSLYPLLYRTSRPDVTASRLQEGRVAMLLDTSPHAVIAPALLTDFFIAADDYYLPPVVSLMLRTIRVIGALLVILTPALYIAVAAFNPDLLPFGFLQSIAQNRSGIPMTVVLEVIFMTVMMELLHEASVRLPQKLGAIATVFGGLILGQSAATARIISNIMVIIVAISAIGSFVMPSYEMSLAIRGSRWLLIIGAAFFGTYALAILLFTIVIYLNSLNSFGTPYLAPFSPLVVGDVTQDTAIRMPYWLQTGGFQSISPRRRR